MNQTAWTDPTGDMANVQLHEGDTVVDFRGQAWTFVKVSRSANRGSEGRVMVRRLCRSAYPVPDFARAYECVHAWHRDGIETQEYFPSVFNLYLGDDAGNKA